MNKIAERAAALVLMVGVSLGAAAGYTSSTAVKFQPYESDGNDTVMTINGDAVGSGEYSTYMLYNMQYYDDMYSSFGLTDIWDNPEYASNMGTSMPDAAKEQALYTHVVLQKMNEYGLSLSYQKQKEIKEMLSQSVEQAGGEQAYLDWIGRYGFNETGYQNFMYTSQCYAMLNDYLFGKNGMQAPTDDELLAQFRDNYIMAKHILISTTDPSTGEQKRTNEEAREEAQAILERIQSGEDFDELMSQFSEDPGASTRPEGYIFTEGDMLEPFYEGAKALAEDEVSEPIQSDVGYHIIKRVPLDETQIEDYRAEISEKLGKNMDTLLNQWMSEADVQTTELFNTINYENVYDYALVDKKK